MAPLAAPYLPVRDQESLSATSIVSGARFADF
jgi:hypothetical protein